MRPVWIFLTLILALASASSALAASSEAVKRNNYGSDLVKQGKMDEAVAEFRRAIELDPGYAIAQLNLAHTYDRLGRVDEAIAAYKKGLDLDPGNATAWNNFGVLFTKKDLNAEAIRAFEQGLKIDASNTMLQQNLANAKRGQDLVKERETRIADARKQVEARPRDARAAYNLARVYASFDMQDQAFEWLGRALALGYDDPQFVREDPVLRGLRGDPRFSRLMEGR
jgi:tetratricopeptide (TPR) repeat protein